MGADRPGLHAVAATRCCVLGRLRGGGVDRIVPRPCVSMLLSAAHATLAARLPHSGPSPPCPVASPPAARCRSGRGGCQRSWPRRRPAWTCCVACIRPARTSCSGEAALASPARACQGAAACCACSARSAPPRAASLLRGARWCPGRRSLCCSSGRLPGCQHARELRWQPVWRWPAGEGAAGAAERAHPWVAMLTHNPQSPCPPPAVSRASRRRRRRACRASWSGRLRRWSAASSGWPPWSGRRRRCLRAFRTVPAARPVRAAKAAARRQPAPAVQPRRA